jgi:RNA polymerase sigma-54 factor
MLEMMMVPGMEMRTTPALVSLAHALALPTLALQQLVQHELEYNPALDEIEQEESTDNDTDEPPDDSLWSQLAPLSDFSSTSWNGENTDPFRSVTAPYQLTEHLLTDLHASLPTSEYPVARLLVESLDDQGFLVEEPETIAQMLSVSLERVEGVLYHLRELGPPGIATRDVRECLLAQLDALAARGSVMPGAHEMVRDYLDDLGAHRHVRIARQMGISVEQVNAVRAFVQQNCWPYPAPALHGGAAHANRPRYRLPDIAVFAHAGSFAVEVLQSPRRFLHINPLYQDLARHSRHLESDAREHVQDHVGRARTFLNTLQRRDSTLRAVGNAVVKRQRDFLRKGVRHLKPMTRAEIAAETGVHESTVSRAVADKSIVLPDGSLIPFSDFFVSARPVQDILRDLITNETRPLSDAELADLLTEQGHNVARRTVAKYRDQMQILPSTLR